MSSRDPLGPSRGVFWPIIISIVLWLVLISLILLDLYLSGP